MIDLQEAINKVLDEISDEEIAEIMEKFLLNNHTLSTIYGFTSEQLEAIYALAHGEYESGKYERAHSLFQLLCHFDHMERRYWMGLGATRQMLRRHEEAVDAYSVASLYGIEDPDPPMHAAECHLVLGDREAARSGFQYVVDCARDKPEHQHLKQRAEARLSMLEAAGTEH